MHIAAGLVGLPNVGKSTLFNAITRSSVPAENYPFCTIAPHIAFTAVPDERIAILQEIYGSTKLIPATIQFVDIAGLVKGAASGEGLGNQFLGHIREVDLIIHVIRCFEDPAIVRSDSVDPLGDFDIISTELMIRDSESVAKRQAKIGMLLKAARNKPQELAALEKEEHALTAVAAALNAENLESLQKLEATYALPRDLLLSTKKFLIVANCGEDESSVASLKENRHVQALAARFGQDRVIPLCVRLEWELSQLTQPEAAEMAALLEVDSSGMSKLIAATYKELGLITFFTCGPKEIHAWPLPQGTTIRKAAGEIHSDLERGFICSDVWSYTDLVAYGSEAKLRADGRMRTEGHGYIVQNGDIINVKFNV